MKKIFLLLVLILTSICIVGCDDEIVETSKEEATAVLIRALTNTLNLKELCIEMVEYEDIHETILDEQNIFIFNEDGFNLRVINSEKKMNVLWEAEYNKDNQSYNIYETYEREVDIFKTYDKWTQQEYQKFTSNMTNNFGYELSDWVELMMSTEVVITECTKQGDLYTIHGYESDDITDLYEIRFTEDYISYFCEISDSSSKTIMKVSLDEDLENNSHKDYVFGELKMR